MILFSVAFSVLLVIVSGFLAEDFRGTDIKERPESRTHD